MSGDGVLQGIGGDYASTSSPNLRDTDVWYTDVAALLGDMQSAVNGADGLGLAGVLTNALEAGPQYMTNAIDGRVDAMLADGSLNPVAAAIILAAAQEDPATFRAFMEQHGLGTEGNLIPGTGGIIEGPPQARLAYEITPEAVQSGLTSSLQTYLASNATAMADVQAYFDNNSSLQKPTGIGLY